MSIKDNNRLIAQFLKWRLYEGYSYITPFFQTYMTVAHGMEQTPVHRFEELKFHKSWDWLIPVIDKIRSSDEYIAYKNDSGQFENEIHINTKFITTTHKDVIEYIQWYNKNKEQNVSK